MTELLNEENGSSEQQRRVLPLCIFAAGRTQFDCIVRGVSGAFDAKCEIFLDLHLEDHGWKFEDTGVWHSGYDHDEVVFSVERFNSSIAASHSGEETQRAMCPQPLGSLGLNSAADTR